MLSRFRADEPRFNLKEKTPLTGISYEVLDDQGFSVLARIIK